MKWLLTVSFPFLSSVSVAYAEEAVCRVHLALAFDGTGSVVENSYMEAQIAGAQNALASQDILNIISVQVGGCIYVSSYVWYTVGTSPKPIFLNTVIRTREDVFDAFASGPFGTDFSRYGVLTLNTSPYQAINYAKKLFEDTPSPEMNCWSIRCVLDISGDQREHEIPTTVLQRAVDALSSLGVTINALPILGYSNDGGERVGYLEWELLDFYRGITERTGGFIMPMRLPQGGDAIASFVKFFINKFRVEIAGMIRVAPPL